MATSNKHKINSTSPSPGEQPNIMSSASLLATFTFYRTFANWCHLSVICRR